MIGIHVPDDFLRRSGQRIGPGTGVFLSRDPPHYAEAADEVDTRYLQPVICEVSVRLPILRVLMARKIQISSLLRRRFRGRTQKGDAGGPQGVAGRIRLSD